MVDGERREERGERVTWRGCVVVEGEDLGNRVTALQDD